MLSDVFCSYCLRPRQTTGRLVASPLAAICQDCARNAFTLFASIESHEVDPAEVDPAEVDLDGPATPWDRLSDEELLARLPEVAEAGRQVETHLGTWVAAARSRGLSWARVGEALGMSRQSAWERFTDRA